MKKLTNNEIFSIFSIMLNKYRFAATLLSPESIEAANNLPSQSATKNTVFLPTLSRFVAIGIHEAHRDQRNDINQRSRSSTRRAALCFSSPVWRIAAMDATPRPLYSSADRAYELAKHVSASCVAARPIRMRKKYT